jgi:hypothetical protein
LTREEETLMPEVAIFARHYANATISRVQYERFAEHIEREDLDGVSAYRMIHSDGGYIIAVIDATNRAGEFPWAGDPYPLSEEHVRTLIDRIEPIAGADETHRTHWGSDAPRLGEDGHWYVPTIN